MQVRKIGHFNGFIKPDRFKSLQNIVILTNVTSQKKAPYVEYGAIELFLDRSEPYQEFHRHYYSELMIRFNNTSFALSMSR